MIALDPCAASRDNAARRGPGMGGTSLPEKGWVAKGLSATGRPVCREAGDATYA
ncbi:unnamed protein product [marine sediment metagenome]|uniref:Uncharacterized protein n=1 Tax=marine sediment metagenome TaxID=412755 RepID=X1IHJ5_9ZZZZ